MRPKVNQPKGENCVKLCNRLLRKFFFKKKYELFNKRNENINIEDKLITTPFSLDTAYLSRG